MSKNFECSYLYSVEWPDDAHSSGGAERYLEAEFGTVQPLVFGHFGEVNRRFLELIDKLAEVVSFQHHRVHGWKSASAGICRAKAGIMRRVSMAVLRETARHVTRGLDVVGPQCVQACRRVSRAGRSPRRRRRTWTSSGPASTTIGVSATTSGPARPETACVAVWAREAARASRALMI